MREETPSWVPLGVVLRGSTRRTMRESRLLRWFRRKDGDTSASGGRSVDDQDVVASEATENGARTIRSRMDEQRNRWESWWLQMQRQNFVILPNSSRYKAWWSATVLGATITGFVIPYVISFPNYVGLAPYNDAGAIIQYLLETMFLIDIVVNFNLAYYVRNKLIMDRKLIAKRYLSFMFWVDLVGVFPFDIVALAIAGQLNSQSSLGSYLGLFRLLQLVRLYRFDALVKFLQYQHKVSLLLVTFLRNVFYVLFLSNMGACGFYFIARQEGFDSESWIGQGPINFEQATTAELYIVAMYWALSTLETIGFGDYTAITSIEQAWASIFIFLAMMMVAYVQTSFLLFASTDLEASAVRDSSENVVKYFWLHNLDSQYRDSLLSNLQARLKSKGLSDDKVLQDFPLGLRLQVLRRLYSRALQGSSLFHGVGRHFVDEVLTNCRVELFMPGVDILEQGSSVSSLFVLVEGSAIVIADRQAYLNTLLEDKDVLSSNNENPLCVPGDVLGAIHFFTGGQLAHNVQTLTECKVLVLDAASYRRIGSLYPKKARVVLRNLLQKIERHEDDGGKLLGNVSGLRGLATDGYATKRVRGMIESNLAEYTMKETTALRFAASQGDAATVRAVIRQGINVNIPNDEGRTALMIAAAEGDERVVSMLLDVPDIDVNAHDAFGRTALREAVENKHNIVAEMLLKVGGSLGLSNLESAKRLSIAIAEEDDRLLAVLLLAGAPASSQDYCGRSPLHVAAYYGNVTATALLLHHGADPNAVDNWGRCPRDEAILSGETQILNVLDGRVDVSTVS
mmetsp:Transcript_5649/g.35073  ORF Transcript_5649/g.35073 Transcript_5649/m.35073 type:complete len:796 (+) Transcript_5649:230-2617(+)